MQYGKIHTALELSETKYIEERYMWQFSRSGLMLQNVEIVENV